MSNVYQKTIDRLEPEIAMIDAGGGWASIAISLKRIADSLERLEAGVNSPNEYGEIGAAAIAGSLKRGLRNS